MLRNRKTSLTRSSSWLSRRIEIVGVSAVIMAAVAVGVSSSLFSNPVTAMLENSKNALPQALATAHIKDAARVTQTFGWKLTADALEVTQDEGQTWTNVTPTNVQPNLIRAVSFNDPLHGWLVTSASDRTANASLVAYRTVDGGRSWLSVQVAGPSAEFGGSLAGGASIDFVDARRGWIEVDLPTSSAFSFGGLFRTDDGGATWIQLKSPAAGTIAFATPNDGWLAGGVDDHHLFATHDGGQTWSVAPPSLPNGTSPSDVVYTLAARPGIVGLRAEIAGNPGSVLLFDLTTQNTWHLLQTLQDSSNEGAAPVAIAGTGALTTVLDRGQETIVIPDASGKATSVRSDLPITPNAAVRTLSFVTPRNGWAIVSGGACARFKADCTSYSALYTTSDGGASWTQLGM